MGNVNSPSVVNISDLRRLCQKRLPRVAFEYIDGGADAEVTLRENCRAFDDVVFRPRSAVKVGGVDLKTRVLGMDLELPFLPGASLDEVARDQRRAAELALAAWVKREQLRADETLVEQGDVLDRAEAIADERGSPLLVIGAAGRAGLERLTTPSMGRELAATASIPVAIVPPQAS